MVAAHLAELSPVTLWTRALLGLGAFAVSLTLGLVVVAAILTILPERYFQESYSRDLFADHNPVLFWTAKILKNLLGWILVILGLVLSLPGVPGQGLLTILIGLTLLDLPGKRRFEQKVLAQPTVRRAVNGMRARFGRPPFLLDGEPERWTGSEQESLPPSQSTGRGD
jgi:hypothetical protein